MAENQLAPQNKNPVEVWKDVPGYEGLYQASTCGKVMNYGRELKWTGHGKEKPKVLKPFKDKKGYLRLGLVNRDGKRNMFGVHRVIAMTFIPNPENKPYIDHINSVKDDNRVENLRWCTSIENAHNPITFKKYLKAMEGQRGKTLSIEHRRKLSEIRKGSHPSLETRALQSLRRKESARPIIQISLSGEVIKEWKSALFASKELGIDQSAIYKCLNGKLHKTGSYIWKLKQ